MQSTERKLAAIMFTDIVGYSALTQSDESHALQVLERHNRLLRPLFPKYQGRQVKTIGDSFLVEFDSALNATLCAIEIQKVLHDYNFSSHDSWKIKLRIGIHLGEVVRKGEDIFGDAVNIASRIEPLATAEGICISQQVFDQVHNKIASEFERVQNAELKNVRFQTNVYAIILPWEHKVTGSRNELGEIDRMRVAVLPFSSLSPDRADEYFADGITEELISTVSKISNLQVIARTSVAKYKGGNKGIAEIARELNVGTILEGSVRKAENRVRITAQLIDSRNETHLWTENYDRELKGIFELQSEIAEKIASSLRIRLLENERSVLVAGSTVNTEAHDKYLLSKQLNVVSEHESVIRYLEDAIRLDPNFALAYASLSSVYVVLAGDILPSREAFSKAKLYLTKALELDEQLPEAWNAKGNLALQYDWDYQSAEASFKKAIELNPSYANAYSWYGMLSATIGNVDRAVEIEKKATGINPVPIFPRGLLCLFYALARRNDDAIRECEKFRELHPNDPETHNILALAYFEIGQLEQARKELALLEQTQSVEQKKKGWAGGVIPWIFATNSFTYAATRDFDKIRRLAAYAEEERKKGGHVERSDLGTLYLALGNKEKAFEMFDLDLRDKSPALLFRHMWRGFDPVRGDDRFITFLKRLGLDGVVLQTRDGRADSSRSS